MKNVYPSLDELRTFYSKNKQIPPGYEEVILKALSHFPELVPVHINFELKQKGKVPFKTSPDLSTIYREQKGRHYTVSILEEADPPMREALFKNLPEEAQRAAIAHELGHVLQFHERSAAALALMVLPANHAKHRQQIRKADLSVIKHGLGFELYVHAVYISRVPGYFQKHKELERDYLKPQEIMDTLAVDAPGFG